MIRSTAIFISPTLALHEREIGALACEPIGGGLQGATPGPGRDDQERLARMENVSKRPTQTERIGLLSAPGGL